MYKKKERAPRIALMKEREKQQRELVTYQTGTSLEIRSRRPMAFQIDGDAAGQTPASIQIVPGALKVIVPPVKPEGIFQSGSLTEETEKR